MFDLSGKLWEETDEMIDKFQFRFCVKILDDSLKWNFQMFVHEIRLLIEKFDEERFHKTVHFRSTIIVQGKVFFAVYICTVFFKELDSVC